MKIQKYLQNTANSSNIVIKTDIDEETGFGRQSIVSEMKRLFLVLYFCNFIEGLTLCLVSDDNRETFSNFSFQLSILLLFR